MKYKFKTKPYPHQVKALKRLLRQNGGGLQVPMRWGKTKVAIDFSGGMYLKENVRRVLIITVTSGLTVWEDQIALHCPMHWRVISYNGEILSQSPYIDFRKGQPWEMSTQYLDFMIVNYQNVYSRVQYDGRSWAALPNDTLKNFIAGSPGKTAVIVDESHHIGNPTAEQSKYSRQLGWAADFRVIMTGSMFHRKPPYVFGQALFYDRGASLGSSWSQYKKRIQVMGGYGNYEVKRYRNLGWMTKQVKTWCHMEKYVPPGKPVINLLHFELEDKNLEAYLQMLNHRVIRLNENDSLTAEIILTLHLHLQQICGGYLKKPSGGYKQIGNSKLLMCEDRLREYREQEINKAVIGCRFTPELVGVGRIAKRLGFQPILFHGRVPPGDERRRRIAKFQDTSKPALFISQISTGKESIDLSVADTMMWYSLTQSYVEFDQFRARIELFQDKRRLMYDFLVAQFPLMLRGKVTSDEENYKAMELKRSMADHIVDDPAYVERITAAAE